VVARQFLPCLDAGQRQGPDRGTGRRILYALRAVRSARRRGGPIGRETGGIWTEETTAACADFLVERRGCRATPFLVGLLFGLGLCLSGMTDPIKVLGFLDL